MEIKPINEANWSEARLQAECFQWHHATYPDQRGLLFTVDNNASDSVKGNVRKAMGRIAGVSDMIYLYNGKAYCLEFKLPGERQSKAQKEWQGQVEKNGMEYGIISYFDDFKRTIRDIHEYNAILPF